MAKYKLGDIVTLLNGRAYLMPELQDSGKYRILRVGNLSGGNDSWYYSDIELDENKYCENGDLLYAWACNFGPHIWREEKVIYHYHIWKLVENKEKVDRTYLYYYLLHQTPFYLGGVNGATMVHITKKNMEKKTVYIPSSLNVQHRIASILSTYDSLIENNAKRIRLLEKMAENLYKEWFVRFRFPGHENVEMENGLPKGWKVEKLGEWGIELETGKRPKGGIDGSIKDGCPSLGAECIKELASFDYSSVKMVPKDFYDSLKRGKSSGNDILLYKDGAYIGKVTMFRDSFPYSEYSINEHVFFLSPMNVKYRNYLYFTLHQKEFFALMQNLNRNAAQPGLSRSDVERVKIVVPPSKIVEFFDLQVERMLKVIFSLAKQNFLLARQRDLLLPRLMSGKLEVKEELLE